MFNEHMDRHTQRSESDAKCQYCDYWVPAGRLLHQHLKLHQSGSLSPLSVMNGEDNSRDSARSDKQAPGGGLSQCSECPYRGKTKDLNAHRKLHKERPGAEFKCPECPYWVTHSRLLQQHVKVSLAGQSTASTNLRNSTRNDIAQL